MRISKYTSIYEELFNDSDSMLKRIKETIDFSFVNKTMEKCYCKEFGRPAAEPEMMFKLQFLKVLLDISDEKLIHEVKYNMEYKYFLVMLPEDSPVDASLLAKFRTTRVSKDLLDGMLKETIRQAIEKELIKSTAIIVDSTHSHARYKHKNPREVLRKLSAELRRRIYETDYDLSFKFPDKPDNLGTLDDEIEYLRRLIDTVRTPINTQGDQKSKELLKKIEALMENEKIDEMQSIYDEDAKTGHKSPDDRFFGYKNHIAINEENLITALKVTNGAADDGKQLSKLISQSKENGINVEEVIADTAYSSLNNLEEATEHKLISKVHPIITMPHTKERKCTI